MMAALTGTLNFGADLAMRQVKNAMKISPDGVSIDLDMLDKHGFIEHDASLTREDSAFGDNTAFSPAIWKSVLDTYEGATIATIASASRARYSRVRAAKEAHDFGMKPFEYGINELVLSYGQTALVISALGSVTTGEMSINYMRTLFGKHKIRPNFFTSSGLRKLTPKLEQERLPWNEGWRPTTTAPTTSSFVTLVLRLVAANEHKLEEAIMVGVSNIEKAISSSL
jgi:hypothetical protein